MPRPCCRNRRSVAVVAPFVDSLDDALFVIDASVEGHPFGLVVILLDDDRRVLTVVQVDGIVDDDIAVSTCTTLLGAAGPASPWRAAVIATDRADRGIEPAAGDATRWEALCDRFGDAGVELIDWLLLDGDLVRSLAESFGRGVVW